MSFTDVIKDSVLNGFNTDISTIQICVILGITVLLGAYIFLVYRIKSKTTFYSKDFNVVLAGLPVITAGIVLAMQSSIVISLGMVGALSIVRFRNAVKSSMDLLFLFWSISVGIICGAGIFDIAVIMSLVITVMLFGLDLLPVRKASMLLIVNSKDINVEDSVNKVLKKYATNSVVKSRSVSKNGVDLIIELKTNKGAELINECCKIEGLLNVNLLSHDGERKF